MIFVFLISVKMYVLYECITYVKNDNNQIHSLILIGIWYDLNI